MSASKIGWTQETWNPTTGCDRVSPGCDNCYALTMAARLKGMGQAKYQNDGDPRTSGPGFGLTVHPSALDIPLRWRKPRRVFVNSMSDLFHQDVPDLFIRAVWEVMAKTPQHTYQVLTKRLQHMAKLCGAGWVKPFCPCDAGNPQDCSPEKWPGAHRPPLPWTSYLTRDQHRPTPLPNVWLGTSIESDRYAFRADHLRKTPAAVRFLGLEPLLGPLPSLDLTGIDWVIVGGESGPNHRDMHPDWLNEIAVRCHLADVPLFVRQDSHARSGMQGRIPDVLWARKDYPRSDSPVQVTP